MCAVRWVYGVAAAGVIGPLAACDVFDRYQPGTQSLLDVFEPPSYEQAAEWALNDYDADERYRGITLLTEAPFAGEPVYLAMYRDRVNDEDSAVRQAAIRALGLHGSPEDAALIAERLGDRDRLVRVSAAQALQKLHNPAVAAALIERVDADGEREAAVRAEAAHALGQYRTIEVVQALIRALGDRSLAVNHNARRSLGTLTGQDFGYDRKMWLEWVDSSPGVFAAGRAYTYPGFSRPRHPVEWLPFVPQPPKASEAPPVGLPRDAG